MTTGWYTVHFTIAPSPVIHVLWRSNYSATVFYGCPVVGVRASCRVLSVITCVECMARWLPRDLWMSPFPVIARDMLR